MACSPDPAATTVHPHGRGERAISNKHCQDKGGSSPRAWGTAEVNPAIDEGKRFIPTGVGNGEGQCAQALPCPVHPHGRGERMVMPDEHFSMLGSSPRAWGTGHHLLSGHGHDRFIPTGVGNGCFRFYASRALPVHPHGRGERAGLYRPVCILVGSSPRAWGTEHSALEEGARPRFIPTGVGNGSGRSPGRSSRSVHPHGRGERRIILSRYKVVCGSSPRAWGTAHDSLALLRAERFIPTGVGNGKQSPLEPIGHPVHPHGRGERGTKCRCYKNRHGSSPRAWGTDTPTTQVITKRRFIPTGVGNGGLITFTG